MSLDQRIREAIEASVGKAGQSDALARRIVAWMEAVTSGNEDPKDTVALEKRLELLYEATEVDFDIDDEGAIS